MLINRLLVLIVLLISFASFNSVANANDDIVRAKFYYRVFWEDVICIRAPCPQYSVQKVNTAENPISVLEIVYPRGLDQSYLTKNQSKNVIVYGCLQPNPSYPNEARDFIVSRVYKALPLGNKESSSEKYYIFGDNGVRCIKAPCPNIVAVELNTHRQKVISSVNQPYAQNVGKFFDSNWLLSKTIRNDNNGLIGLGNFNAADEIDISNSFINLPDPHSKCPRLPLLKCQSGYITTYERDSNRCLTSPTCTKSGICTLSIPVCPPGYQLVSFPSSNNGCPQYYCDPVFVSKTK